MDLHEKGVGRNDIARITGTSTATVSRLVRESGGSFDTSQTRAATEHRLTDLAERRSRVSARLVGLAERQLDAVDQPFRAYSFGGSGNTFADELLDAAPPDAVYTMARTVALSMKTSMELTRFDSDQGQARAGNLLDALAAGITEAARILDDQDDPDTA